LDLQSSFYTTDALLVVQSTEETNFAVKLK